MVDGGHVSMEQTRKESMGSYGETFDWLDFRQGRVRYVGQRRGRDEPPIDVFAVSIGGAIYYGEIRKSFLVDGNNYNLEIVSFGWLKDFWFDIEPDPRFCAAFSADELGEVQVLLCQAVTGWRSLEDSPFILGESVRSRFMGEVIFRDDWALIKDDGGYVA